MAGLSMAPLSMAPQLDLPNDSEPSIDTKSSSTSQNLDSNVNETSDSRRRPNHWVGVTTGAIAVASLALVVVAVVAVKLVRNKAFDWRVGDDASISSLPTTVYFGNGNCGTF